MPRRYAIAVTAALLAVVAATNRWMSFQAGFDLLRAHDESDFHAIAVAAPHLPTAKLQSQHAQRFAFHYVIGLIARGLGANVDAVYFAAMALVALAVCALLARILRRTGCSRPVFALGMAVFVLNTYALRYYGLAPGEIADLLFELGVLASLVGCLERRLWLVLAGVVWGTLARQSEVPVAVALAVWVIAGPGWREDPPLIRALRAGAVLLATAAVYAVLVAVASTFSVNTTPGLTHFLLIADLEALPHGAGQLGQHFLRSVNGLLSVAALLLVAGFAARRGRDGVRGGWPFALWGLLLVAAAVVLQPVVFSPQYAAHNETRLAVMGLPPLVCALGLLLSELERREVLVLSGRATLVLIAILAVGSFHHLYTWIGTGSADHTVGLQILAALALAAVTLRVLAVPPRPRRRHAAPADGGASPAAHRHVSR